MLLQQIGKLGDNFRIENILSHIHCLQSRNDGIEVLLKDIALDSQL